MAKCDKGRHVDFRNMAVTPPEIKKMIKKGTPPGQFNTAVIEEFPEREIAGCEVVAAQGQNNSHIVLGRDRDASLASGKGGSGGTKCGMIDLCAGHMSGLGKKATGDVLSGPNFALDAARIYITQRGNIDQQFQLFQGNSRSRNTDNESGIGIKADHTRVIGRRSIKLYAGKGNWEGGGTYGEPNSKGGEIQDGSGTIELIAGNYKDIQPAVKGKNMVEALKRIYKMINGLVSAIHFLHTTQLKLSTHLMMHIHPALGQAPSPSLVMGTVDHFIKSLNGSFDTIMKQLNTIVSELSAVGLGSPKASIPGFKDVLSNNVFLS